MRTTLTLDDDVAVALRRLCDAEGMPFKEAVNSVLRAGIVARSTRTPRREGPWTIPADVGRARLPDLDDVDGVLRVAEGDDYR